MSNRLEFYDSIPPEYEGVLYQGISNHAFEAKAMPPIAPFGIFIKDIYQNVLGGVSGFIFYGSMYVDALWVEADLRGKGWGRKLMEAAEKIGKEKGAHFANLNTMDFEALPFYQKLGYTIEFVREGYDKGCKMYLLRKPLFAQTK